MLLNAIDNYLGVRHAAGFKLKDDTFYLYDFARFATTQGDSYVTSQTAIAWAGQAHSESQRATRLKTIIRFARFSYAADNRHEVPPQGVFCFQRHRPTPLYGLLVYCKPSFQFFNVANRDQDCSHIFGLLIEVFLPQDS